MSATNALETALLQLIFNGTTIASLAQNASSSPYMTFYISLHTGDPGEAGTQASAETAYTGYARLAVARDGTGWTISGNEASNAAQIAFGLCTANPGSPVTHFGIGTSLTGSGNLLLSDPLDSSVTMQVGVTPIFSAGALKVQCN